MGRNLPYAEDIGHYWQTGASTPDSWLSKIRKLIEGLSGKVIAEGYGSSADRSAYMFAFKIEDDGFKVIWPVLPSRTGKVEAAKRQAVTLLYHDIKAKAMTASVLGAKVAFFSYLVLPDGRVTNEIANNELAEAFSLQLTLRRPPGG